MSCGNVKGMTIGTVEKITGVPRRKIKYYIEQKILRPSQKAENGYWLYSEEDIVKVQLITLYHELDYPDEKIRLLISDPAFEWRKELDRQIASLMDGKECTENKLLLAEYIRYRERMDRGQRMFEVARTDAANKEKLKRLLCGEFYRLLAAMLAEEGSPLNELVRMGERPPESPEGQEQIGRFCEALQRMTQLTPDEILFRLRLIKVFSGLETALDLLMERSGGVHMVTEAVQIYCDGLEQQKKEAD